MLRKSLILAVLLVLGCCHLGAQTDLRKAFEEFTTNAMGRYAAFTDSANLAFAKALADNWARFELQDGQQRQKKPKPETLPVADKEQNQFRELTVSEIERSLEDPWSLETNSVGWLKQKASDDEDSAPVRFNFYGAPQTASIPWEYGTFHPKGISEKQVAAFWEQLSRYNYEPLLADASSYAKRNGWNGWVTLEWVQALSACIFPKDIHSEQSVFTVFLLNQMGLKTKIARADGRLVPLFASKQPVYARKFLVIGTYIFYLVEKDFPASEVFTYDVELDKAGHPLDLRIREPIKLGTADSFQPCHKESPLFQASFDLPVNEALMRFYSHYPQTNVTVYATARPEERFASALLPALKDCIQGPSELDAVQKILTFVQTDFQYRTDLEQFGFEKPFFFEENFLFEANDCEDRAAMFAYLVKELTTCKAVLLEYSDHVAAAVCFPTEIKGDFVKIHQDNYYICDPSYIGATPGMTIPHYKNQAVKVYVL